MDQNELMQELRQYIAMEVLEGEAVGLEPTTQLLELGLLNSMELMKMVQHIEEKYKIIVPPRQIRAENFRDLNAISNFVIQLQS